MPATLGAVKYQIQFVRVSPPGGEPVALGTLSVDIPLGAGDQQETFDAASAKMHAAVAAFRAVLDEAG